MSFVNRQVTEIVRVTENNGVKHVRLPRWFVKKHQVERGSYVVFRERPNGRISIEKWDDYVKGKPGTDDGSAG